VGYRGAADTVMEHLHRRDIHETREWIVRTKPSRSAPSPSTRRLEEMWGGGREGAHREVYRDTTDRAGAEGGGLLHRTRRRELQLHSHDGKARHGIVFDAGGSLRPKWAMAHQQESFLTRRFREI